MYDKLILNDKHSQLPEIALSKRPRQFLTSRLSSRAATEASHRIDQQTPRHRLNSYFHFKPDKKISSLSNYRYTNETSNKSNIITGREFLKRQPVDRDYTIKRPYRKQTPKISIFMNRIQSQVKQINTVLKAHIEATNDLLQNKMDHIMGEIHRYKSQKLKEQYNSDQQPESQYDEYIAPYPSNYYKSKKLLYKGRKEIPKIRSRLSKERIRYLTSKWRKCANCVLFIIYLKRFYSRMRGWKQKESERIIEALPAHFKTLRQTIQVNIHNFANLLYSKREIMYDILESDSKEIGRQKIELARVTINTLLKQLLVAFKANKNNNVFAKFLYIMCKHGNFCAKKGLLTKEELQISCISQAYKTIAADKLLQKISLINFIFIKLVLYKIFYSEDRLSQAMKLQNTPKNIYIIGSILYTLAIDMQNDLLQKIPHNYKLGNYLQFSSISLRPSLVLSNSSNYKGEILSGLRDRRWVQAVYRTSSWEMERNLLRQIIETAYQTIIKFHAMLIKTMK